MLHVKTLRAFCFCKKYAEVTCFFGLLRVFTPKNSFYKSCFSTQFYIVTHFSGTPFVQTEVAIIRRQRARRFFGRSLVEIVIITKVRDIL